MSVEAEEVAAGGVEGGGCGGEVEGVHLDIFLEGGGVCLEGVDWVSVPSRLEERGGGEDVYAARRGGVDVAELGVRDTVVAREGRNHGALRLKQARLEELVVTVVIFLVLLLIDPEQLIQIGSPQTTRARYEEVALVAQQQRE